MASKNPQSDKAGFEYYLEQVQRGREVARRGISIDLLRILNEEGGELPLINLAKLYLPPDASLGQINEFLATINQLKEAGLILVARDEGSPEEIIANAAVKLTDTGAKLVASGLASKY